MNELERFNRKVRNPFNENVNVIDHISYCMDELGEKTWFEFIHTSIPATSAQFRKPHLTVAYSPTEITDFPKIDFESEVYYSLPENEHIILPRLNVRYYIYTDPFNNKHLVLSTPVSLLIDKHQYYLSKGATWMHGVYDPFIIIETNTEHNDLSIQGLPLPNRDFIFNTIRFCRFGELVRD